MPWTNEDQRTLIRFRDEMYACLTEAMRDRHLRDEIVAGVGSLAVLEPAWVAYERGVMLEAVNRLRVERGLASVELADVARVEQLACGHVDYATKYALYCAELAMGITPRELAG